MKTVLAAVIAVLATSAVPAFAEPSLALRGAADLGSAPARTEAAPAPVASATTAPAPAKKVRVVLASPYGA